MTEVVAQKPKSCSMVVGILAFAVLIVMLCSLGQVLKSVGYAFLFVPYSLGVVQLPTVEDVLTVDMNVTPTQVEIPKPGRYAMYVDDYDLLVVSESLLTAERAPWLKIRPSGADQNIPVDFIRRGMRPYDSPLASGRPIYTFVVNHAGLYELTHPTRNLHVWLMPDYTTGQEQTIFLTYVLEIAILALLAFYIYRRGTRTQRERQNLIRQTTRRRADDLWKKTIYEIKNDQLKK